MYAEGRFMPSFVHFVLNGMKKYNESYKGEAYGRIQKKNEI